jgi:hypothetical protein
MTKQQLSRIRQFKSIVKKMGGDYNGHNIDNYQRIAAYTSSSVPAVKSWMSSQRVIPQSKLDLLKQRVS